MRVVHSVSYKTRSGFFKSPITEDIVIEFEGSDLLPEEKAAPAMYHSTLLQIRAEKQAILVKQSLRLLHKDAVENDRLARERATQLDVMRNGILSLGKR